MYDEIIIKIRRSLSGNPDLDKDFLVSQLDFYKNHEYAPQIIKEISKMFWDCLSPYEVDFLNRSHENNEILKTFDNVIELVENNDKKAALELLDKFMETFVDKYSLSEDYEYHSFLNPLEELIFYNYIGFNRDKLEVYDTERNAINDNSKERTAIGNISKTPFERRTVHSLGNYDHIGIDDPIGYRRKRRKRKPFEGNKVVIRKKDEINNDGLSLDKETRGIGLDNENAKGIGLDNENAKKPLRLIPYSEPVFDLYYIYGSLLASENRFDEAEIYLKKALRINPVSSKALLELADIYKLRTVTFNRFFLLNMEALKYAYSLKEIARAYRNIAYYYLEEYNLEVASVFYNYSLKFDYNVNAVKELGYIKARGIDAEISDEDAIRTIKSKNIQADANPFILDALETLCNYFESKGFYNSALYFYRIMYDLTKDSHIFNRINQLQNRI